ncbi:MAG: outer membrane beta-barrel protein [Alphaproteobacteria bacterium]|nr:outer membrane beta-barrel protein [Alphaproteobacteria bacterium]MDE2073622.1 outer membrane beta-barrel protein [Alphaproteobacteria bacterium]
MSIRSAICAYCALLALATGFSTNPAQAQGAAATGPPQDDIQPPPGLPLGSFRLHPSVTFYDAYDDNIYRTNTLPQDSFLVTINPSFTLASNWGRHALEIDGALEQYLYRSVRDENHTNFDVGGGGRLQLADGMAADGRASYTATHELRNSEDLPQNAITPTRYTILHADADIVHERGRLSLRAGGRYDKYNFDPAKLLGGGLLDNTDRNRQEYEAYVKGNYEFSPGYSAFLRASYDHRKYTLSRDRFGIDRNSDGYRVDAGIDMLVSRLIEGNVFAGYSIQRYSAPLGRVGGLDYGIKLTWSPTELVTVRLNGRRTIGETTIANAAADDEKSISGEVSYAFRRQISLHADAGYINDHYSGAGRTDETLQAGTGAKYFMNEHVTWDIHYQYSRRTSPLNRFAYDDNTIMLGFLLRA